MKNKKALKLTKREIDEKVLEFLKIDEEIKELQKKHKTLKTELESQYVLSSDKKETIKGFKTIITKIPLNYGRNNIDIEKIKPFLKSIRKCNSVIKKVEIIDMTALNKLIKDGKIPLEVVDKCREDKWSFKSTFKRIESKKSKQTTQTNKTILKAE